MGSFHSLLVFLGASVFLTLAPGPDHLFVITQVFSGDAGSPGNRWLRKPWLVRYVTWLSSAVLVWLGIRLILARR